MRGELNITDSCYSRLIAVTHFLTGGQDLKIKSDGM